jgi:hypothetical protein
LLEHWFEPTPSAEHLANKLFDLTRREQSTYEVTNEIEEINAAAAHMLTYAKLELRNGYLVRVRSEDLDRAETLASDAALGETGVIAVDFSHRDFIGNRKQFTKLMGEVITGLHERQDRIRKFKKAQLECALKNILAQGTRDRPTLTAQRCECLLGQRTMSTIGASEGMTREELAIAHVPEKLVRYRAGARWLRNGGYQGGDGTDDWLTAEAEARAQYADHFVACHFS